MISSLLPLPYFSDSEDEDKLAAAPPQSSEPDLDSSTTKYLPPVGSTDDEDSADTGDETGEKTLKPGATPSGGGNEKLNYVQLETAALEAGTRTSGEEVKKKESAASNYVEVKESKNRRGFRPIRPLFGKKKSSKQSKFFCLSSLSII